MCKYCVENLSAGYNFGLRKRIKKTVNIASYLSIRQLSHNIVHEEIYVVCRRLFREGHEISLIEGKMVMLPYLNHLYFLYGAIKLNKNFFTKPLCIEMLQLIPDRESKSDNILPAEL